jgi:hypothetical protein
VDLGGFVVERHEFLADGVFADAGEDVDPDYVVGTADAEAGGKSVGGLRGGFFLFFLEEVQIANMVRCGTAEMRREEKRGEERRG